MKGYRVYDKRKKKYVHNGIGPKVPSRYQDSRFVIDAWIGFYDWSGKKIYENDFVSYTMRMKPFGKHRLKTIPERISKYRLVDYGTTGPEFRLYGYGDQCMTELEQQLDEEFSYRAYEGGDTVDRFNCDGLWRERVAHLPHGIQTKALVGIHVVGDIRVVTPAVFAPETAGRIQKTRTVG
jgi:hypothetical protein